jgi:sec-independent protein translocase protein TatA
MPSLGPAEILVILVVALLVFGPNKMPEIGRQVARGVREFRRVQQHLSSELQSVVSDLDPTAPAPASSGGDPVPTLPPKDATGASGTDTSMPDMSESEVPESATPAPSPADDVNPGPQAKGSDSTGESPSSPPADPA